MGRRSEEITDTTPLDGARIDVAARIGWLLRCTRMAHDLSLRALAQGLGRASSAATLSRLETHGTRHSRAITHYESVLDLPYGWLRAPIDVLCRTYSYAPRDHAPHLPDDTLADYSRACEQVETDPGGTDWLRFAEHHVVGARGLPLRMIIPHLHRLASELGRSVAVGYTTRYEALAKLRCSEYAAAVDGVVRDLVLEDGCQVHADLLSAVAELPTPELARWCGELLLHDRAAVARSAGLAVQNMHSVGGLPPTTWEELAPVFAHACNATAGDEERRTDLATTLAACAPEFRHAVAARLTSTLPEPRRPAAWTQEQRLRHHALASDYAARIADGRAGQAMLGRLVFELLYDFRATHAVTSAFLLNASPFSADLQPVLVEAAWEGPDEVTRHGAAAAFSTLMLPWRSDAASVEAWLAADDPVLRSTGFVLAAQSGVRLPADTISRGLAEGGAVGRNALFAAGMSADPMLDDVAADPEQPGEVRAAARWWQRTGARVEH